MKSFETFPPIHHHMRWKILCVHVCACVCVCVCVFFGGGALNTHFDAVKSSIEILINQKADMCV